MQEDTLYVVVTVKNRGSQLLAFMLPSLVLQSQTAIEGFLLPQNAHIIADWDKVWVLCNSTAEGYSIYSFTSA